MEITLVKALWGLFIALGGGFFTFVGFLMKRQYGAIHEAHDSLCETVKEQDVKLDLYATRLTTLEAKAITQADLDKVKNEINNRMDEKFDDQSQKINDKLGHNTELTNLKIDNAVDKISMVIRDQRTE